MTTTNDHDAPRPSNARGALLAPPDVATAWRAKGGRVRAERLAAKRAEQAAAVVLSTVSEMRSFLERRAGEVEASDESASVKANAAARLVTALTTMDGYAELVRENQRLNAEIAVLRASQAQSATGDWKATFGESESVQSPDGARTDGGDR